MSFKFGQIGHYDINFVEQAFNKNQVVYSTDSGSNHVLCIKDHYLTGTTNLGGGLLSVSGSHWASIHHMFYMSGSSKVNPDEVNKFNDLYHGFNQTTDLKPFYKSKFYDTASVFYIPQQTFGERIKPGSFQLTARTGSASTNNKKILITDDSNGNLYSTNAQDSRSMDSLGVTGSMSSSLNYVGNIFYDLGVVTLTETASWSGSVNYTDIGGKNEAAGDSNRDYKFWECRFNSTTPIFTTEYTVKVNSTEFNATINNTARGESSGSNTSDMLLLRNQLTGSDWLPYFNQIQLYRNEYEEPVIIANLPRSIQVRDDIDLIITFRIDH